MLNPTQTFHIVVPPEIRGRTCFIAVSNCPSTGVSWSVKNVYARCRPPKNKMIAAEEAIRIREIIIFGSDSDTIKTSYAAGVMDAWLANDATSLCKRKLALFESGSGFVST